MENTAMQVINELAPYETQEAWTCKNDSEAEWALKKIAEERVETQRYVNVCNTMAAEYQFKAQKACEQLESKTAYLKQQLQEYFATVPHKATKTQETYKLPSGTLKLKYGTPEFVRDETALVKWLKANGYEDKIKTKETADWAEFKKCVGIQSGKVVTLDGEIVEGVTANERPNSFEVEI